MNQVVLFDGFLWDEGNIGKCQKHGLSLAQIEQALSTIRFVIPDPHSEESR